MTALTRKHTPATGPANEGRVQTRKAIPALLAATLLAVLVGCAASETAGEPFTEITVSYPAKAPANWPLFIAQEGGYYEQNGMKATLQFGVHPAGIAMLSSGEAQMTNYTLEQAMQAVAQGGDFVLVGSPMNTGLFAMMSKDVNSPAELKGKKFGVSQIGDAPYNFASAILEANGLTTRDVDWIPIGTEGGGRVAALTSGRIDATMVPPPAYFLLEGQGYKEIANLADYDQLYAPMTYVIAKSAIARDPSLPERLIKAHAEAIKRYYDDKAFAMEAYAKYDPLGSAADVERIYDHDRDADTYERIPYVLAPAVEYIINHQVDEQLTARLQGFDFSQAIDNSYVDKLVEEGFFRELYGPEVAAEEERKAALAFR